MKKRIYVEFALLLTVMFFTGCGLIKYIEVPKEKINPFSPDTYTALYAVNPAIGAAYSTATYNAETVTGNGETVHAIVTPIGNIDTVKTGETVFDWVLNLLALFGGASMAACVPFIRRAKPLIKVIDKLAFNVWGAKNEKK